MPGRTTRNWTRAYIDGYDLSGNTRSLDALTTEFEESDLTCYADAAKGYLPGHPTISPGMFNGVLDNTATTGIHAVMSGAGVARNVMIPIGIRAEPAQGDPVFCGQFIQDGYTADPSGVYVNIPFGPSWSPAGMNYAKAWGWLLRPKTATSAANTAIGIDDLLTGTTSTKGGWMMYQVFAAAGTSTMTATITVQEADTNSNGSFALLSGATTGVIACQNPTAGIIQIGTTATVKQFLRWQIDLSGAHTATSVTFALAFIRNTI